MKHQKYKARWTGHPSKLSAWKWSRPDWFTVPQPHMGHNSQQKTNNYYWNHSMKLTGMALR